MLTVEACISFTIFMMVVLTLMFIMRIVYTYGLIQHAAAQTAKELSMYTYLYQVSGLHDMNETVQSKTQNGVETFNQDAESLVGAYDALLDLDLEQVQNSLDGVTTDPKVILKNFTSIMVSEGAQELNDRLFELLVKPMMAGYIAADVKGEGADRKLKDLQVEGGLNGLDLSASHFFENGNTIDIVVCYTIHSCFPINIMPEMNMMNRAVTIGLNGKSVFDYQKVQEEEEESIWDKYTPTNRGDMIMQKYGNRNLPSNFKAYSNYDKVTKTATAERTIDIRAKTYQDESAIKSSLRRNNLNKMRDFDQDNTGDGILTADEIETKILIIYIPASTENRSVDRTTYDKAIQELQGEYPDIKIITKEIE